ncbi:MAG: MarR family transcriptional regulator [Hyphomicrobiales bacterium]|nr:MAG: MarR family transcriptional regulator [Hyphomicrobiales bacterium]
MTDINKIPHDESGPEAGADAPLLVSEAERTAQLLQLTELLFFAYRDFISDPDEILSEFGFGRAHHRVVHFVSRNPGIKVADLLDILAITKQSLGRVLKQLIEGDFIRQQEGPRDRRQRLLYLTAKGRALAVRLSAPQLDRLAKALEEVGPGGAEQIRAALYHVVSPHNRHQVSRIVLANQRIGDQP